MNHATAPANAFDDWQDDNAQFLDANPCPVNPDAPTLFKRNCYKCGGTGSFGRVSALGHSRCTACQGRGYFETKVSPAQRDARNARKQARQERAETDKQTSLALKAAEWSKANPAEAQWIADHCERNDFARKMAEALKQWGSLTEGQVGAIRKGLLRDATHVQERAAQAARSEAIDIAKIEHSFKRAGALLKFPTLRLASFIFTVASPTSRNPGAIYVKRKDEDGDRVYLGKIQNARFEPSRFCTPEEQAKILQVAAKPAEAASEYGRLTGHCAICARLLTKEDSLGRGIGPVCAERFGF